MARHVTELPRLLVTNWQTFRHFAIFQVRSALVWPPNGNPAKTPHRLVDNRLFDISYYLDRLQDMAQLCA